MNSKTAHLIKIGNSKGLIIPTEIRKLCHLENCVKYEVIDSKIIISSVETNVNRKQWKEELLRLGANKDTTPVFMDGIDNNSDKDWVW